MKFLRASLAGLTLASAAFAQTAGDPKPPGEATVRPYDAAQQQRMAWFTQARLGMFIHWGLYAVPAGQWPGRENKNRAEWIMLQEDIPSADYEKLAPQFNPVKFDAKAWVAVATSAGMNYLVITAKHHDGFAMYATKQSSYNIVDATPFHRDPLKELADECHRAGIMFCVYYSTADWHHPESPVQYSQRWRDPVTGKIDPNRGYHGAPKADADVGKYADYMKAQLRELLTNYGQVGLIWFDGGGAYRVPERAQLLKADEINAMIHELQPGTLVNNRLGGVADYSTPEQRIPTGNHGEPFEVCMTLNKHWGFNQFDHDWKTPAMVVRNIADIASKGGNYLLNVGPTAEGEIPAESIQILKEVGAWTSANAEAIYGTGPTPFGDELGYEDATKKDKEGHPAWVERNDWRCTRRSGKLYFTLLNWPGAAFRAPAISNHISKAYLLSDPARTALTVSADRNATIVQLPANAPDRLAPVLCLEIDGEVRLAR
jgi:alpha-L-fucosidase